jgi:hypothetical protein
MKMLNKLSKEIIDNIIEWLAFYLANKECQTYEWKKMAYSEIYTILSFENNFQLLNLMNIQNSNLNLTYYSNLFFITIKLLFPNLMT